MAPAKRQPDRREQRQAQPRIQIPENVSEFYVNSLNVGTTTWDFVLFFGSIALPETIGPAETIRGQVRVDCVIRMSPQHAKASLRVLQQTLDDWERRFGEIQVPSVEETSEDT